MSQPTESELLDALDRRANAAAGDLHAMVATVDVPEPQIGEPDRRRRIAPLAIAAAVVLVALVGAVVVRTGGDDSNNTVAGQPQLTHLVLPDPAAAGYELTAAFDGTETATDVDFMGLPVTVQGPVERDDPWSAGVLAYSLPGDITTLDGEAIELGAAEAAYSTDGIAPTVGWRDGDEVRYLVSSTLNRDELVTLAEATVAADTSVGAALPEQRILFAGTVTDVFPTIGMSIGAPRGMSGVAYRELTGDNGLVVATRSGDDARLRAASVAAVATEAVTIRGRDAVVARFGADEGLVEITWLEADGTLVRAGAALTPDVSALVAVLDQLEPIDADEFASLVKAEPVGSGVEETVSESPASTEPADTDPSPSTTTLANQTIASVSVREGDSDYLASLTRALDGSWISLEASVNTKSESSGASADLRSVDAEAAVRNDLSDGTVVIAGIVGPDRRVIEVRDAITGKVIEQAVDNGSEAFIPGSDHRLFLLVVTAEPSQALDVIVRTADDREDRIAV